MMLASVSVTMLVATIVPRTCTLSHAKENHTFSNSIKRLFARSAFLFWLLAGCAAMPAEADQPVRLLGRIEQLSESAVSPPHADQSDPTVSRKSFPELFIGTWIGHVRVDQSDYLALKKSNPGMALRESNMLFVGRDDGIGKVVFARRGNSVEAESPVVQFTPTANDMKYLDLVSKKIEPGMRFNVVFGPMTNATTVTGSVLTEVVTINRITAFDDDVYEQQIVTAGHSVDPDGMQRGGMTEIVSNFHRLSPQEMQVTLAIVKYSNNGAMDSKVIMRGSFMKR